MGKIVARSLIFARTFMLLAILYGELKDLLL